MSATLKRPSTSAVDNSPPLNSRGVVVLTGLCYLMVGLGYSYLDIRFGYFGLEGSMWLVWALLGFGAGAMHVRKPVGTGGQLQWMILGSVGTILAVYPGFLIFNLLRWVCLFIMVLIGARAAVMRTRRDFYFALTGIFVVSFMVGTHGNADWTLWVYLGPAWALGGLALAWEYAAGAVLSRWVRLFMTLGFLGIALALAILLFLFLPRPSNLGFGFLPPGTDTPGMFTVPAGGGNQDGKAGSGSGGDGGGSQAAPGQQPGDAGKGPWEGMVQSMRADLKGKPMPGWQRDALNTVLGMVEGLVQSGRGSGREVPLGAAPGEPGDGVPVAGLRRPGDKSPGTHTPNLHGEVQKFELTGLQALFHVVQSSSWWLWLLLLLMVALLWWRRYRIGLAMTLGLARLLAHSHPQRSMQLSAMSLRWCLHVKGHRRLPGQSVREHWGSAARIAPLARRWLGYAVEDYCAMRFGRAAANPQRASRMQQSVQGACDIVMGRMPELSK